jgi:hypothetical protein
MFMAPFQSLTRACLYTVSIYTVYSYIYTPNRSVLTSSKGKEKGKHGGIVRQKDTG